MRGMSFNLQPSDKGALEILRVATEGKKDFFWTSLTNITDISNNSSSISCGPNKRRKGELEEALLSEPRSVLEKRSPSPPTSTSTLSSSLGGNSGNGSGGGAASFDSGGVAAVSDKCLFSSSSATAIPSPAGNAAASEEERKDEWAAELPPIPASLGGSGGGGSSVEDWEAMLSEPAVSTAQDQNFLRWIMGDIDDGLAAGRNRHQLVSQLPIEFDAGCKNDVGVPFVDPAFGFEGSPLSSAATLPSSVSSGIELITKAPKFERGNLNSGNNQTAATSLLPLASNLPLQMPPEALFPHFLEEKCHLFGPSLLNNHLQTQPSPSFFLPPLQFASANQESNLILSPKHLVSGTIPPLKRQASDAFHDSPGGGATNLFLRRHQPQDNANPFHLQTVPAKPRLDTGGEAAAAMVVAQQQQVLVDQLFKAVELVQSGNSVSAHGILARLNHQLPTPGGKPLLRSAFYFKEALQLILSNGTMNHRPTSLATPIDVMMKLRAYKAFSEVSPVFQFTNFTCVQVLLEELGGADCIHIIDFDIGIGGQWSSFMQELAQRRGSAMEAIPVFKITALVTPGTHHPLELHLTHENLSHFAGELHIPFEFNALNLDPFDPSLLLNVLAGVGEATAVHLPIGSVMHLPFPTLLRFMKQLSPKLVISVNHGFNRCDLPFAHHFIHAFQSCTVLLDSIDAAGTNQDSISDIERFLIQPRIESSVLARHAAAEKTFPWRTLFASAGFVPLQFSNFTETQAECLLKRVQVKGFHVEKHQASLSLLWQQGELVSVSAWKC